MIRFCTKYGVILTMYHHYVEKAALLLLLFYFWPFFSRAKRKGMNRRQSHDKIYRTRPWILWNGMVSIFHSADALCVYYIAHAYYQAYHESYLIKKSAEIYECFLTTLIRKSWRKRFVCLCKRALAVRSSHPSQLFATFVSPAPKRNNVQMDMDKFKMDMARSGPFDIVDRTSTLFSAIGTIHEILYNFML